MTDEDREQCEDYLELERYIEKLQTCHATQPPVDLTPESTRIYHMAAFFTLPHPALLSQARNSLKRCSHACWPWMKKQKMTFHESHPEQPAAVR